METKGEFTCGHTFCDIENRSGKEKKCNVAVDVDAKAYKKWLFDTICKAEN